MPGSPDRGSRHEDFRQHGAPRVRVFQSPDDPRFTGLIFEVEDLKAFQSFLESPEAVKAEAEDGVKAKTLKILKEVSRQS